MLLFLGDQFYFSLQETGGEAVIFLGSVKHDALVNVYDSKVKLKQLTFGLLTLMPNVNFVRV